MPKMFVEGCTPSAFRAEHGPGQTLNFISRQEADDAACRYRQHFLGSMVALPDLTTRRQTYDTLHTIHQLEQRVNSGGQSLLSEAVKELYGLIAGTYPPVVRAEAIRAAWSLCSRFHSSPPDFTNFIVTQVGHCTQPGEAEFLRGALLATHVHSLLPKNTDPENWLAVFNQAYRDFFGPIPDLTESERKDPSLHETARHQEIARIGVWIASRLYASLQGDGLLGLHVPQRLLYEHRGKEKAYSAESADVIPWGIVSLHPEKLPVIDKLVEAVTAGTPIAPEVRQVKIPELWFGGVVETQGRVLHPGKQKTITIKGMRMVGLAFGSLSLTDQELLFSPEGALADSEILAGDYPFGLLPFWLAVRACRNTRKVCLKIAVKPKAEQLSAFYNTLELVLADLTAQLIKPVGRQGASILSVAMDEWFQKNHVKPDESARRQLFSIAIPYITALARGMAIKKTETEPDSLQDRLRDDTHLWQLALDWGWNRLNDEEIMEIGSVMIRDQITMSHRRKRDGTTVAPILYLALPYRYLEPVSRAVRKKEDFDQPTATAIYEATRTIKRIQSAVWATTTTGDMITAGLNLVRQELETADVFNQGDRPDDAKINTVLLKNSQIVLLRLVPDLLGSEAETMRRELILCIVENRELPAALQVAIVTAISQIKTLFQVRCDDIYDKGVPGKPKETPNEP